MNNKLSTNKKYKQEGLESSK